MSIKILSADEIKQKKNSYDIPPVLFANPKNLYQRRAKRLRELAKDHPLADYLLFAADVVESQLSVFEKNPLEKQHFNNLDELEPLNTKTFKRSSIWIEYLKEILHSIKPKANEQVLATIENLEKASDKELEEMASHLLNQEFNLVSTDKAVFIWGRRFVFVVVSVWCDILNHSNVPFLLLPPQSCSVKYITGAEVSSNLLFIK